MLYNISMITKLPTKLVQEADNLAKETGIPFQDTLEVLYKAYLKRLTPQVVVSDSEDLVGVRGPTKVKGDTIIWQDQNQLNPRYKYPYPQVCPRPSFSSYSGHSRNRGLTLLGETRLPVAL